MPRISDDSLFAARYHRLRNPYISLFMNHDSINSDSRLHQSSPIGIINSKKWFWGRNFPTPVSLFVFLQITDARGLIRTTFGSSSRWGGVAEYGRVLHVSNKYSLYCYSSITFDAVCFFYYNYLFILIN